MQVTEGRAERTHKGTRKRLSKQRLIFQQILIRLQERIEQLLRTQFDWCRLLVAAGIFAAAVVVAGFIKLETFVGIHNSDIQSTSSFLFLCVYPTSRLLMPLIDRFYGLQNSIGLSLFIVTQVDDGKLVEATVCEHIIKRD